MIFPNYWQDDTAIPYGYAQGGAPEVGHAGGAYALMRAILNVQGGGEGDLGLFMHRQKAMAPFNPVQGTLGRGPLSKQASGLASLGRNGDSMLMHVNADEVNAMAHSINPETGLPEAFPPLLFLLPLLGGLAGSAGAGSAIGGGLAASLASTLAPVIGTTAAGIVAPGLVGAAGTAIGGFAGGTVKGAIEGKSAGEALKEGAITGATAAAGSVVGTAAGAAVGEIAPVASKAAIGETAETLGEEISQAAVPQVEEIAGGAFDESITGPAREALVAEAGDVATEIGGLQKNPFTGQQIVPEAGVGIEPYVGLGGKELSTAELIAIENPVDEFVVSPEGLSEARVEDLTRKAFLDTGEMSDVLQSGKNLGWSATETARVAGDAPGSGLDYLKLALSPSGKGALSKLGGAALSYVPGQTVAPGIAGAVGDSFAPRKEVDHMGIPSLGPAGSGYPGSSPAGRGRSGYRSGGGGGYPRSKQGTYLDPYLYQYSSGGGYM